MATEAPTGALDGPKLEPLAAAKLTWQPTARWCQKEIKEKLRTDPKVLAAIEQFQAKVQAVLTAPDASQFHAAQSTAAGYLREHEFLRWAPLPYPLPKL
jgi:hypothetical protein